MPRFPLPLMLALLLPSAMVSAEKKFGTFIDEGEPAAPASIQEGKQWEEGRASLPPWPAEADLVELKMDFRSPGNFRYFIDGRHLGSTRMRWCATPWWPNRPVAPAT